MKLPKIVQHRHCSKCERTSAAGARFHLHHIKPRCMGGTNDPSNLLLICDDCHRRLHSESGDFRRWGSQGGSKAARDPQNFRRLVQFQNWSDERFDAYLRERELAGIILGKLPQWLQD